MQWLTAQQVLELADAIMTLQRVGYTVTPRIMLQDKVPEDPDVVHERVIKAVEGGAWFHLKDGPKACHPS